MYAGASAHKFRADPVDEQDLARQQELQRLRLFLAPETLFPLGMMERCPPGKVGRPVAEQLRAEVAAHSRREVNRSADSTPSRGSSGRGSRVGTPRSPGHRSAEEGEGKGGTQGVGNRGGSRSDRGGRTVQFVDQGDADSGDSASQDWPAGALSGARLLACACMRPLTSPLTRPPPAAGPAAPGAGADAEGSGARVQSRGTSVCPVPPATRKRGGQWDEAYTRRLARYGVHRDVSFTSQPRLRAQRKTAALCEQILKQVDARRQRVRAVRDPPGPLRLAPLRGPRACGPTHQMSTGAESSSGSEAFFARAFNSGVQAAQAGRVHAAYRHWVKALPLARALGDQKQTAALLGNLGVVCKAISLYDQAITFFSEVRPSAPRPRSRPMPTRPWHRPFRRALCRSWRCATLWWTVSPRRAR